MKDNTYDLVLSKLEKRIDMASDRMAKNFKGMKPFDKEPIKTNELLQHYEGLTPEDIVYLIEQHGPNTVNDFIGEMETAKMRRDFNA